ncbi:MAG: TRAM domain-containing protein [Halapricum sp.]
MEISDQLRCLFSATVEERDDSYVVEVPNDELRHGQIEADETYRVALLPLPSDGEAEETSPEPAQARSPPAPPVEKGETHTVEIESLGEQGDGITRVERGFVVIVPDTKEGERVTVEITDVRQNVAFASVVERLSYDD